MRGQTMTPTGGESAVVKPEAQRLTAQMALACRRRSTCLRLTRMSAWLTDLSVAAECGNVNGVDDAPEWWTTPKQQRRQRFSSR